MKHEKTFETIDKLKDIEMELHRLKNALEMANKALDAQRQWVGLSEEEILKLAYPIRWQEVDDFEADKAVNFAQMIEAKLKEKNT